VAIDGFEITVAKGTILWCSAPAELLGTEIPHVHLNDRAAALVADFRTRGEA